MFRFHGGTAEAALSGAAVKETRLQTLLADTPPPPAAGDGAVEASGEDVSESAPASAAPPPPSQTALALQDVGEGVCAFRLWGLLGWQDIRQRYRRSTLGPFWLTISMGALVGGLGMLYAGLFKMEVAEYLPFVAAGLILWGLISGLITEGCTAFIDAEGIIKQVRLPLSIHVCRVVWRNLIVFAHNVVIYVIAAVFFSIQPGWTGLLALPGIALLCLNGVWMGLLLGLVSARFRDIPQIVASVVQVTFFLTPIIWKPELLPDRAFILDINPFFHLVEMVRAPALGQAPRLVSWLAVLGITLGGWLVTLIMYRRYRWRIAYWA